MLNINFRPTFVRTATFRIPSGRGFSEQSCEATFDALTIDEFAAFDLDTPDGTRAFLERVLVNLADLVDGDGNAVTYSPAVRDALLAHDWGRIGLVKAYIRGRQEAAEGN